MYRKMLIILIHSFNQNFIIKKFPKVGNFLVESVRCKSTLYSLMLIEINFLN